MNGHGGKRRGSGRPQGARNTLPAGATKGVKSLRWRVPENTPAEIAAVADEGFGVIVGAMRGQIQRNGFLRMGAAVRVREEVCGPIPRRTELAGVDGETGHIVFTIEDKRKP